MRTRTIAIAGLAAAAVAYLFDPTAGDMRRSRLRARISTFAQKRRTPQLVRPPLPVNMIPEPASEIAEAPERQKGEDVEASPRKRRVEVVTDTPLDRVDEEVADTPEESPTEGVATPPEESPTEGVATPPEESPAEGVATPPEESPTEDVAEYMPQERLRGYLADTRAHRPMDDGAIAGRIRQKLLQRHDLDTGSLLIDVVQGVAFLRGELKDRQEIDEIVHLTRSVSGVRGVQNLIVIQVPESETISRHAARTLGDAWNA